jgi:short-subunit dehydrogenase involved in D-alanine esterification of teichoic acids
VDQVTVIHQTNLVTEAHSAALDVERDNIESLLNSVQQIHKELDVILNEAKLVAKNTGISCELPTNHNFPSESDAKQHYTTNVFFVIIDTIIPGLTRRFESLRLICRVSGFSGSLTGRVMKICFMQLKISAAVQKEISKDLCDEVIFIKRTYSVNF